MVGGPPFSFEFVPAPADLSPYLNSLYVLRIGPHRIEEVLPAYSGQLMLASSGKGRMDFGDGFVEAPEDAFFTGPLTAARPFSIDGPALVLGASFTFHGWAALTRLPTVQNSDRFLTAEQGLGGPAGGDALSLTRRVRAGEIDAKAALGELGAILRTAIKPLPAGHADLIQATYDWLSSSLNPEPERLYASLPLSERQVQRLVKRFFGLAPSRLRRRYRAIRAATLLADPGLSDARRIEVLQSFYDQAHLIREIREFTGRTPRLLASGKDAVGIETLGPQGYGVVELFAGEESEQLGKEPG
ncbi:MAG TPA: helix-turn-helix domain-containing protein [Erythrobacter sp.]|nr:helix-turn-helix domain-containing protein [Erythrobacter sp.]